MTRAFRLQMRCRAKLAPRDEAGFTTVGMVLALLITLSLVFSSAQVYRIMSVSADVQGVSDAVALAAENEVGEFMIVVRVCDAVVLSLSLTGIVATGLGVAALCTPATAAASETLLAAGRNVMEARDSFAEKASAGLERLQGLLPFLAAANGASVAQANGGGPLSSSYLGLALLVPTEGEPIGIAAGGEGAKLADAAEGEAEELSRAGERAERAAQQANAQKEQAWRRDCGDAPGYCMYERASALAGMPASENPRYRSVDAWSFSVALDRAKAYYRCRAKAESPEGSSVDEQARSALRARFYAYAAEEVGKGYVHETEESFDALFPRLPRNTDEMRGTALYTEQSYPVTDGAGGPVMHAWPGCPSAGGASSFGSVSQMEDGDYATCPDCGFAASSLGKVAAASSSIDNGFEYHYAAVAEACDAYRKAREQLDPLAVEVRERAGGLFDRCRSALEEAAGCRIDARPPGRFGAVAFVVADSNAAPSAGFESAFVAATGRLGARAAVSAATLVADTAQEGRSVVSSLLDGLADDGGAAVGAAGVVLDCWSGMLHAYLEGQQALQQALRQAVDAVPFASASGLGTWAAAAFGEVVGALGLQPAKLDALKPVLVNSAHVAAEDASGFSARLLSAKEQAIAHPSSSTDVFSSLVTGAEQEALEGVEALDGRIQVAVIEPLGEEGPSIPLSIALPPAAKNAASGLIEDVADGIRSVYAQVTGVRAWE